MVCMIQRMLPGLDLYYTDPEQLIITAAIRILLQTIQLI